MTAPYSKRTYQKSTVLGHIRTILSDGCWRTSAEIAGELRRFDVRLTPPTVERVILSAARDTFAYDQPSGRFSIRGRAPVAAARPATAEPPNQRRPPKFALRQRVQLIGEPGRRGRIVDGPRPYDDQYEYCVVMGDHEGWYAEDDLAAVPLDGLPRWQKRDEFLRDLLLAKLRGQLTDSLYSYGASRTQFVAYQFRPALKFLRNPDQRILIADEVGLGKTIEAAIIYLELKARLNISRVLVLCPSRLKAKWRDELRNRFEEEFVELDSQRLRTLLADNRRLGGRLPFKAIASFETMRSQEFIDAWTDMQIPLDLLIVDEAHYLRNQDTRTFALGTALTDSADAVIFLTATPLHLRNRDLFNLLHLLAPGEYSDPGLFEAQIEPNAAVIRAARHLAAGNASEAERVLREVEGSVLRDRFLQNPYYHDVLQRLRDGVATDRERIVLQRELYELNTLSTIFTRTRKREVAHAAVRSAYTICVDLTPAERRFYDAVLTNVQQELSLRSGAQSFASVMKERQAASCLAALREAILEGEQKHATVRLRVDQSAFDFLNDSSAVGDDDPQIITPADIRRYALQLGEHDSKFDMFEQVVRQALTETPNSKVLVFSFFRRTLAYLQRRLQAQGFVVESLNGDVPVADRKRIIDRFRNDPSIRIMLSSEVGAEGLDFQFCDILVNYDLPWNPMQVEQRIGRLDRFGQEHEKIRIFNFYIADTIETRIFQRLYDRIGIFERSIGDLEAILGEQIRQLSDAALRPNLTPAEQERLAEEAAQRILRHQIEEEDLERQKDELLGQEAIFNQQIQETIASGRVISADEVCALVSTFLADRFPRVEFVRDEEEPCYALRTTPELVACLEQYILDERRGDLHGGRFFEALQSGAMIPLTFDSELARKRPLLEFVTIRHPLAAAAAQHWQHKTQGGVPAMQLQIEGPSSDAGSGYFFIYQLSISGARPHYTLHPVIVLDDGRSAASSAEILLSQLQQHRNGSGLSYHEDEFIAAQQRADREMARHRDQLKVETLRRNAALIAAQKASIQASFAAKIRRAEAQGRVALDDRIRRMRQAQARNLEAALKTKLAALEQKGNVSVSYTLIAGGRVRITPRARDVTPIERPSAAPARWVRDDTADYEPVAALAAEATSPPLPAPQTPVPSADEFNLNPQHSPARPWQADAPPPAGPTQPSVEESVRVRSQKFLARLLGRKR